MISLFLLALVGLWLAWPYLQELRADRETDTRANEKVAQQSALVARMPESPSAHEALGDALRAAGKVHNAIATYQTALELQAKAAENGQATSGTALGGTGLEHKLRLVQMEAAQNSGFGPAGYGTTLQTRQQVCRQCGTLNGPNDRTCASCNNPLLVDGFWDTLKRDDHKQKIKREAIELVAMVHIVLLAILLARALPIEVQGCLGVSATGVLIWRFLKRIGDGSVG